MTTQPVKDTDTEPTIGQLVADASRDVSALLKKEIELAKSELKVSVRYGGAGIVFFLTAAFVAVLALVLLSWAFVYLIHWNGSGLDLHWAFLIVTGAYLLIAGLFVLLGVRKVKRVRAPERSIRQAKEIPAALKGKA
ncbi:phage holin family protein [Nocardioides zeae]|uniref:Phage holin family protein n=1 Tax=Nocardioides imazamoxiresistens TaxID=3231893 RepID=A0ABU3Q0V4_9ACTN|nr:phage holin family protein [Nocardioides zeae]MDT9594741.1 phage holin family protein [Nocardioides zeae]